MCLTIYMLSHLLVIVVQSLRWKWCEVSVYPNGYQPIDSYQIKYFDHWPYTVATFQMPRNDHVLRRNYCYRMHLKYAQHTQCKNYGPLLFRDAFYEAVSYRMTHSECSFFPIAIFGHVMWCHSFAEFLVKFIFWGVFINKIHYYAFYRMSCEKLPSNCVCVFSLRSRKFNIWYGMKTFNIDFIVTIG